MSCGRSGTSCGKYPNWNGSWPRGVCPAGRGYKMPLVAALVENVQRHGVLAFEDVESDPAIRHVYENILRGLGTRSKRYAMLVDDGVVKQLNIEQGGKFEVSDAQTLLSQLG